MTSLSDLTCSNNYQNTSPLSTAQIDQWLEQLNDWQINTSAPTTIPQLQRTFNFQDYLQSAQFVQQVVNMAEQQDHHPEILLVYGKVTISWWTHALGGLHQNDFICSAKTEQLYDGLIA